MGRAAPEPPGALIVEGGVWGGGARTMEWLPPRQSCRTAVIREQEGGRRGSTGGRHTCSCCWSNSSYCSQQEAEEEEEEDEEEEEEEGFREQRASQDSARARVRSQGGREGRTDEGKGEKKCNR